jgi:hypothetical protein
VRLGSDQNVTSERKEEIERIKEQGLPPQKKEIQMEDLIVCLYKHVNECLTDDLFRYIDRVSGLG